MIAKNDGSVTVTITASMNRRWIPYFLGMLRYMEYLGNVGSSREITFMADGDGDFRPKFVWPKELTVNMEGVDNETGEAHFDAG